MCSHPPGSARGKPRGEARVYIHRGYERNRSVRGLIISRAARRAASPVPRSASRSRRRGRRGRPSRYLYHWSPGGRAVRAPRARSRRSRESAPTLRDSTRTILFYDYNFNISSRTYAIECAVSCHRSTVGTRILHRPGLRCESCVSVACCARCAVRGGGQWGRLGPGGWSSQPLGVRVRS